MAKLSTLFEIADCEIKRLSKLVYGDRCICCLENPGWLDAGHYINRDHKSVRWDIHNVFPQCRTCNRIHEEDKKPMRIAVLGILGKKRHDELVEKSKQLLYSITEGYMRRLIAEIREAIKEVKKLDPDAIISKGKIEHKFSTINI